MMKKFSFLFLFFIITFSVFSQNDFPNDSNKIVEYLEFREVDIKDVLRQLAKQFNLNIVFSESVKGLITVQLHNVTIEQALDSIITINGFIYTKKGNIIKVTTPEEAEKEGKQTRVFKLSNSDASKLKDALKKVLSSEGSIEADVRSNSLIVTDTPAVLNKIEKMIPQLDESTPQVLIEAKFIETSLGTTEKLGIKWTITATVRGSKRPTTLPFDPRGEKRWMYKTVPSVDPSNTGAGNTFPTPYGFPYATSTDFTFGTLDFTEYQMVLDFLKTNTDSKLISSPRVVTMDNKEAEIYIGKARPIPQFEFNSDTGEYQITDFEEKIEGVTLTVTPQVSKVGDEYYIRLKLKPKVTTFSENVAFTNPSFNYPVLAERYADTEVMIKDGQTIVIGGLIENQKTETIRKVPFLGDLPIIGHLFTHREVDPNTQTELLIFVTARIIKENERVPLAYKSNLITSPPRPFKLNLRKVKIK
jgi:type IV pilus assembly protein PilQ